MTTAQSTLRVLLEIGPKGRRVVAGATDWPGLDRWGKTDDDALDKLSSYLPRYAGVADLAGLADEFARQPKLEVVERYAGSGSTDCWGIAHVPSETEREVLSAADLDRRLDLLRRLGLLRRRRGPRLCRAAPGCPRWWLDPRRDHPPHPRQRARAVHPQSRGPHAA